MILLLPFPPSINSYWRHVVIKTKRGLAQRTLLSLRGRKYRAQCLRDIHKQYPVHDIISHEVKVEMHLFPPDRRMRDIDNYAKSVLDALTHARIWKDDHLVGELYIKRCSVVKGGALTLRIENANKAESGVRPEPIRHSE